MVCRGCKIEKALFKGKVLAEIDKLLSTQSIDDTEMLLELRGRIEKL